VPFCRGYDVIQQAQSGTGKTATFCAGVLQQARVVFFNALEPRADTAACVCVCATAGLQPAADPGPGAGPHP